ncbi:MAG TPA: thrombospondin type 3 repeat-containing protein [Patescibacteria group bacterium]
MKIKNIKISLMILASLIVLSFAFFSYAQESSTTDKNVFLDSDQDGLSDTEEKALGTNPFNPDTDGDSYSDGAEVSAGYNPLVPAPGDRVVPENATASVAAGTTATQDAGNVTQEVTDKINNLVNEKSATESQEILMSDVQSLVEGTIQSKTEEVTLPTINPDEINIKTQDYSNLSPTEQTAQKKEDFLNYATAATYVISSNSPKPITSADDLTSITTSLTQQISSALTSRDPKVLNDLSQIGEKTLDQLKYIEVPEEMVPLHTQGLMFSKYAIQLKDSIAPNPEDPLGEIVNFSKMQGLAESFLGFGLELQNKASQYGISITETATTEPSVTTTMPTATTTPTSTATTDSTSTP